MRSPLIFGSSNEKLLPFEESALEEELDQFEESIRSKIGRFNGQENVGLQCQLQHPLLPKKHQSNDMGEMS